jgi:hypothetical protein
MGTDATTGGWTGPPLKHSTYYLKLLEVQHYRVVVSNESNGQPNYNFGYYVPFILGLFLIAIGLVVSNLKPIAVLGYLVLAWWIYRAYMDLQRIVDPVISRNITRAEKGNFSQSEEHFILLSKSSLVESSGGIAATSEKKIIDAGGTISVNKKGIHYLGVNRRLSWDWNKIIQLRHSRSWSSISLFFPVSNRQKISGFTLNGTKATLLILTDFMKKSLAPQKTNATNRSGKGTTMTGTEQRTNITYNIVQNVHDSVIQGNIESPLQSPRDNE